MKRDVKIERISPGVTNNPKNGILQGELIKTEAVLLAMEQLSDEESDYKSVAKGQPYCTCQSKGKRKLERTLATNSGNCSLCGHAVVYHSTPPSETQRRNGVKKR